ncbi:MAG: hypothetical protein A3G40_02085 [Deltaproteobacteria bacterium RIFCSPLOWO2_12_FULL_57_22]|nr:MAG: hypothetical protein A3G40_02085 [Deltaproteobacteria bacterium RIFCSPLOWO2_12_FULL_57_22]
MPVSSRYVIFSWEKGERRNPFLFQQELYDLMAKEALQLFHVYLREDVKPAVGQKAAVCHQAM